MKSKFFDVITVGARDVDKAKAALAEKGIPGVSVVSVAEAVAAADVLILATKGWHTDEEATNIAESLGDTRWREPSPRMRMGPVSLFLTLPLLCWQWQNHHRRHQSNQLFPRGPAGALVGEVRRRSHRGVPPARPCLQGIQHYWGGAHGQARGDSDDVRWA